MNWAQIVGLIIASVFILGILATFVWAAWMDGKNGSPRDGDS